MMAIRELLARLHESEAGEGVISSAIAVLITAFLGAAMWVIFDQLVDNSAEQTCEQLAVIGGDQGEATCGEE